MKVSVAKTAGFCFGVERAIRIAEAEAGEETVFTLGPIVHNETVVAGLKEKGILPVSEEELLKKRGGKVILRARDFTGAQFMDGYQYTITTTEKVAPPTPEQPTEPVTKPEEPTSEPVTAPPLID